MEDKVKTWLSDIKLAISEIYEFLPEDKSFASFQKDIKGKKAVERNLEIIGEAINRIVVGNPGIEISNARKIIDTRNRVIHNYDNISNDIIWSIVTRDLPKLEAEVIKLLVDY